MARRAVARVNLAAIERNAARLRAGADAPERGCARSSRPTATAMAPRVARAPRWPAARRRLAVASAGEALELRDAGIEAAVLVLGALSAEELRSRSTPAPSSSPGTSGSSTRSSRGAPAGRSRVHVKLDSGMGRYGSAIAAAALAIAKRIAGRAATPGSGWRAR